MKRASVRCKGTFRNLRARGSEAFRHQSGALRKETVSVANLWRIINDFRGALLLRIRKHLLQHVVCKTSFCSKHRASIRNQHPQNTYKHQRNPSVFLMNPRVYKPEKMGGSCWDSNGCW